MRFMLLAKEHEESEAGVLPSTEMIEKHQKYNEELVKAGVVLAAERLHPSAKGVRVRFAGGKRTVIDGPFAETKELVAGFWLWQVRSKEEAIEWLKRAPFNGGVEIELREVFEQEDFGSQLPRSSKSNRGVCARRWPRSGRRGLRHSSGRRGGLADGVGTSHRGPRADRAERRSTCCGSRCRPREDGRLVALELCRPGVFLADTK